MNHGRQAALRVNSYSTIQTGLTVILKIKEAFFDRIFRHFGHESDDFGNQCLFQSQLHLQIRCHLDVSHANIMQCDVQTITSRLYEKVCNYM